MNCIAYRGHSGILRRQFKSMLFKITSDGIGNNAYGRYVSPKSFHDPTARAFSAIEVQSITRQLRKLDANVVWKIEEELREVDKDCDGR